MSPVMEFESKSVEEAVQKASQDISGWPFLKLLATPFHMCRFEKTKYASDSASLLSAETSAPTIALDSQQVTQPQDQSLSSPDFQSLKLLRSDSSIWLSEHRAV